MPEGFVVMRDHTKRVCVVSTTVYRSEQGPQCFGRKLDSEYGGERPREAISETHLRVGKAQVLSTELPERELGHCEGLQRGLGGSESFSIPR
jgi:hypothetical protein